MGILLLLILVASTTTFGDSPPPPPLGDYVTNVTPPPPRYDYMFLSLLWQPGYCSDKRYKSCVRTYSNKFSINGIWPMKIGYRPIQDCPDPSKEDFSMRKLLNLAGYLNFYWPDLFDGKTNSEFWKNEWNKHGKCSPFPLYRYFQTAIKATETLDLYHVLKVGGIEPGRSHTVYEIKNAITQATTISRVEIVCGRKRGTDEIMLEEIKFCLNDYGFLIDCPLGEDQSNTCFQDNPGGVISFPYDFWIPSRN